MLRKINMKLAEKKGERKRQETQRREKEVGNKKRERKKVEGKDQNQRDSPEPPDHRTRSLDVIAPSQGDDHVDQGSVSQSCGGAKSPCGHAPLI
jgi:hypothetical protein